MTPDKILSKPSYDVDLDVTTRFISSNITLPFTLLFIHPGPSCQRRSIRRRAGLSTGTSTSTRTETEATHCLWIVSRSLGLGANPAWHTLDRPNRPSHQRETRTACSCTPKAIQDLKIPGRSQVLFYCHGNPGASVKWESSKIITAFRLGAQWHRVTKDKTPTSASTNPEPCLLLGSEITQSGNTLHASPAPGIIMVEEVGVDSKIKTSPTDRAPSRTCRRLGLAFFVSSLPIPWTSRLRYLAGVRHCDRTLYIDKRTPHIIPTYDAR
ncbi:hypothetical protein LA080_002350 [Diaporthe eres]|nr:hypothetical protein LA080_002350 [Diaporthe eres]